MDRIEIVSAAPADLQTDAVIVMECSDLSRTGVSGLEQHFIINIDHHAGNRLYGALNWFDESAAACGAHDRDCDAHLSCNPDRHRFVPSFEHHAAHVRYLPADR